MLENMAFGMVGVETSKGLQIRKILKDDIQSLTQVLPSELFLGV